MVGLMTEPLESRAVSRPRLTPYAAPQDVVGGYIASPGKNIFFWKVGRYSGVRLLHDFRNCEAEQKLWQQIRRVDAE